MLLLPVILHLSQKEIHSLWSSPPPPPRTLAGSSFEGHWPAHSQSSLFEGAPGLGWDTLTRPLTPEGICEWKAHWNLLMWDAPIRIFGADHEREKKCLRIRIWISWPADQEVVLIQANRRVCYMFLFQILCLTDICNCEQHDHQFYSFYFVINGDF